MDKYIGFDIDSKKTVACVGHPKGFYRGVEVVVGLYEGGDPTRVCRGGTTGVYQSGNKKAPAALKEEK